MAAIVTTRAELEAKLNWKSLLTLLKVEPLPAVFIIALSALLVVGLALTKIPGG